MNVKSLILLWLVLCCRALGYVHSGDVDTWQPGIIPFQIKLGTTPTLQDGTNHSTSVQAAMTSWNAVLGTVQFSPTIVAKSSDTDDDHELNEIVFADDVEGDAYGANVLAITISYNYPTIHQRATADIFFNTAHTWNSYRGTLQEPEDIRRVALHELGHVLGLDHPDEEGQPGILAIMNSVITGLDALAADDIAGAQALYRASGDTAPAVNNNFANATEISLASGTVTVTGTSYYANKETGEPFHASYLGGKSVWWKWTAPSGGSMNLTTKGTHFDSLLGVYTGAAVNGLTTIASNDESSDSPPDEFIGYSSLTFNATAGTTYFIAIDGWEGESGFISLGLTFTSTGGTSAPAITSHPSNQTVTAGQNATFSVAASGTPAPTYQWQRLPAGSGTWSDLTNGGNYSGATSTTLTVSSTTAPMNGDQFRCVATNATGSATSNAATLNIGSSAPAITSQPANQSVQIGQTASFSVAASGSPAPTFQWQRLPAGSGTWSDLTNGGNYSGVTTTTLTVSSTTIPMNGDQFRCVATNATGSATSNAATLIIFTAAPAITSQPANQAVTAGQITIFTVLASGTPAPAYQWQRLPAGSGAWGDLTNGGNYSGVTTTTLTVSSTTVPMSGDQFRCVATNSVGTATSNPATITVVAVVNTVASVSAGYNHTLFIKTDGTLWGMGGNNSGQLGDGTMVQRYSPVFIASNVVSASAGIGYSMFIKSDGTLWGMGANGSGALGDGALGINRIVPVQVATGVKSVAAGESHTLFIKHDGTLWGMGSNSFGQLGDGSTVHRLLPVQVASSVASVTVAGNYTLFVKTDGTLWAMGGNEAGQLGDGTYTNRANPIQIASGVASVSAGGSHTLFVKTDGTLWAMGNNYAGKLGDGTWNGRVSPIQVATEVASVDAGADHNLFLKTDGSLWGMGLNNYGALGDGARTIRTTPVRIASQVRSASAGTSFSMFILANQTLWGTGQNTGALGTGSDAFLVFPTQVVPLMPGLPLIVVQPVGRTVGAGSGTFLEVSVPGSPGATYQWKRNGVNIPDAIFPTLLLAHLLPTDSGEYTVVVTTSAGSVTSEVATLVVQPLPPVTPSDFNKDGHPDILWQDSVTGGGAIWLMRGTERVDMVPLPIPERWTLAGAADFNGDGQADILIQYPPGAQLAIWLMNGTVRGETVVIDGFRGTIVAVADFNADGHPDILCHHSGTVLRTLHLMHGTSEYGSVAYNVPGEWIISGAADFNDDGHTDIVWQHGASGKREIWLMNRTYVTGTVSLGVMPTEWSIAGAADFNNDENPDLLTQNLITGERVVWLMQDTHIIGTVSLGYVPVEWSFPGIHWPPPARLPPVRIDFNRDGRSDIVWQNLNTGERSLWMMNGTELVDGAVLGTIPTEWTISAKGDFNGDGRVDLLWSNTVTGDRAIWLMAGTEIQENIFLGTIPVQWSVSGCGNFDGGYTSDIFWTNEVTGDRVIWLMDNGRLMGGGYFTTLAPEWRVGATTDFSGDGKADILWSNTATGERAIWLMNGMTAVSGASLGTLPLAWEFSATGDFDGNRMSDILLTNTATGDRALWRMNGTNIADNAFLGTIPTEWTMSTADDYSGDGKADILWTNTATGDRAMWLMDGASVTGGGFLTTLDTNWRPVP